MPPISFFEISKLSKRQPFFKAYFAYISASSLFARELADMYAKYALKKGWRFDNLDISKNDIGGIKEASYEINGKGVYEDLRFETGVHRIQRVPATEKSGRVHTSTASVAVLPMRQQFKLKINPADLDMEFSRAGGKGGQNVNKVETARS